MNHFYFAFYIFALLSGIFLFTILVPRLSRHSAAYRETLAIYLLLTFFVLWGTGSLYVAVNVIFSPVIAKLFVLVSFTIIGLLSYLLPRQQRILCGLDFTRFHQTIFGIAALAGPVAGLSAWHLNRPEYFGLVLAIPVVVLIAIIVYCHKLVLHTTPGANASGKSRIVTLVLPLGAIALALTEAAILGSEVVERGVTLSLPLIYLISNIALWIFREDFFPIALAADHTIDLPVQLTEKERQIVLAVCSGLSNKEIAAQCAISPSTVKNHLSNIFKKLGVNNRMSLLANLARPHP